jgi:hypothetical protein
VPKPLNQMAEYEWMQAFCKVCEEIDAMVKEIEPDNHSET